MVVPSLFSLIQREKKADQTTNEDSQIITFPSLCRNRLWHRCRWQAWLSQSHSVPKAVAQVILKAATILEARPYVAGTLDENYVTAVWGFQRMVAMTWRNCAANLQETASKQWNNSEAAKKTKASDWYYYSPTVYLWLRRSELVRLLFPGPRAMPLSQRWTWYQRDQKSLTLTGSIINQCL